MRYTQNIESGRRVGKTKTHRWQMWIRTVSDQGVDINDIDMVARARELFKGDVPPGRAVSMLLTGRRRGTNEICVRCYLDRGVSVVLTDAGVCSVCKPERPDQMTNPISYHGIRTGPEGLFVEMIHGSVHVPFDAKPSQDVINHSPTGFEWGYHGSGPAQLAAAILLDVTDDISTVRRLHQLYKTEVVAGLDPDEWTITADSVIEWLANVSAKV